MNIKKIKLDLTVKFLNLKNNSNILQGVKDAMSNFREEVGAFHGFTVLDDMGSGQGVVKRTYTMRYDRCTLNVGLILNQQSRNQ